MKIENIGMSDFDVWENLSFEDDVEDTPIQETSKRRKSECLELSLKYLYKRAHSESSLLDCIGEFKENHSYNFITSGDIDSLSFLKLILRHQNLEYLLFSTWCMSAEDILQLDEWIEQGKIIKMDAYVGEIFPGSYKIEYDMLKQLYKKT